MAISNKHKFASAIADGGDTSLIRPSNWNDEHDITMATGKILGRNTAGDGAVEEIAVAVVPQSGGFTVAGGTTSKTLTVDTDVTASALATKTEQTKVIANSGASQTIDLANGLIQTFLLTASCTFTLPVTTAGQSFTIVIKCDTTTTYVPTFAAGSGRTLKWAGGSAPARTVTAGKKDAYVFWADDSTDTQGCDGGRNY